MTFGSLFSGIGGMDLGLERAGMVCKWQVEIDPYKQKVLRRHWPNIPKFADVKDVSVADLAAVELIAGGFPCQDISNAGTTHEGGLRGLDGERSGLWTEFYRLIGELEPRWVVIENVGAITVRGLGKVLWDLTASGFDSDWAVVSAGALGAPHLRKRMFIVGRRRVRFASELPECECCGEPYCPECELHFFECNHPGPHSWDEAMEDADGTGLEGNECSILAQPQDWRQNADTARSNWGHPAPRIYRRSDGLPGWMDRIKAVGEAVDPRVAHWIGRRIMEATA